MTAGGGQGRLRVALLTREYPPEVYGGAGVHVSYLARELAQLHGGDVLLTRSADDWTEFEASFRTAVAISPWMLRALACTCQPL